MKGGGRKLPNSPLFFIFAAISEPLRINRRSLAIFPDYELATRQRLTEFINCHLSEIQ